MQIVDTHQHLWDLDLFHYSWLSSVPSLNRFFRMSDYLAATQGLNVVKSVHLEANVDEPYMLDEKMDRARPATFRRTCHLQFRLRPRTFRK